MSIRKTLEKLLAKYEKDTNPAAAVRDLLTDVLHICATKGIDFARAIEGAQIVAAEEAEEQQEPLPEGHPKCIANFHSQVWQNDYAVACDDPDDFTFDITRQVLALGEEASKAIEDGTYDADNLWHGNRQSSITDHDGPFEVEAAEAIEEFWTNYRVWQAQRRQTV